MNRRIVVIVLLPVVLVAAAVFDNRHDRTVRSSVAASVQNASAIVAAAPPRTVADAASYGPVVASSKALDSAWFCAAGTASNGGAADATVVVANSGTQAARVTFALVTEQGGTATVSEEVAAESRAALRIADHVQGDWAAATVTADRGEIAAALVTASNGATSITPCASRASSTWYFAAGSTDAGASELLALYNPYPEDASANVRLQTDAGERDPSALQGIPIPGGSLVMVKLNDTQNRRTSIAASVTAPIGRIVVARIQAHSGQGHAGPSGAPPKGVAVSLGTPNASTAWTWPFGLKLDQASEQYVIFNPGKADAAVEVDVALASPGTNGRVRPIPLTVRPGESQLFDVGALTQVLKGVNLSVTIRSTNGQPIVADRMAFTSGAVNGVSLAPGTPLRATRWIVPAVDSRNGHAYLTVVNPGPNDASITLRVLNGAGSVTASPVRVGAGDRYDVDVVGLGAGPTPALTLTSDQPVVVGALEIQTGGTSLAVGEPEIGTISLP